MKRSWIPPRDRAGRRWCAHESAQIHRGSRSPARVMPRQALGVDTPLHRAIVRPGSGCLVLHAAQAAASPRPLGAHPVRSDRQGLPAWSRCDDAVDGKDGATRNPRSPRSDMPPPGSLHSGDDAPPTLLAAPVRAPSLPLSPLPSTRPASTATIDCASGSAAHPSLTRRVHSMNGLIRASLGNPHAVTVMSLTFIVMGALDAHPDPDRHLAGLQEPGRADADVLRRHVGQQHRQRHHQPDGAVDRPGQRPEAAGVAVDRRRQHRPQLLPGRRRSQRGVDAGQLALARRDPQPAAGDVAPRRAAVRPDGHDAGLRRGGGQRRPQERRVGALRRGPIRGPQLHHGHPRRRGAGGLRRQDPHGPGLPGSREDAGAQHVARRRDEGAGRLQRLLPQRRRQARRYRLHHRLQLDVPDTQGHGRHPAPVRIGADALPGGRGHAQGCQLHPDQRRPGQREEGSLHPGLPATRRQHPEGRRRPWAASSRNSRSG